MDFEDYMARMDAAMARDISPKEAEGARRYREMTPKERQDYLQTICDETPSREMTPEEAARWNAPSRPFAEISQEATYS